MPPAQLARLLDWLLGQHPEPRAVLPPWLPDLVAACSPALESPPALEGPPAEGLSGTDSGNVERRLGPRWLPNTC